MNADEAITLARTAIDKYGADADKPSVHLAKALLELHEWLARDIYRLADVCRGFRERQGRWPNGTTDLVERLLAGREEGR